MSAPDPPGTVRAAAASPLADALAEVRAHLAAWVESGGEVEGDGAGGRPGGGAAPDVPPGVAEGVGPGTGAAVRRGDPVPLQVVVDAFGLTAFERSVLLLAAGVELDSEIRALCARAHGDATRGWITFGLALAALPGEHWSAVVPTAPLRRWQLVTLECGVSPVSDPLRIDERILHWLVGVPHPDDRLRGTAVPVVPPLDLAASHRQLAEQAARAWEGGGVGERPVLHVVGGDPESREDVAAATADGLGLTLYRIRAADLPAAPERRYDLARLWERESALGGSALLVEARAEDAATLGAFVEDVRGLVMASSEAPIPDLRGPVSRVHVTPPSTAEQRALWLGTLGTRAAELNGDVDAVVAQFRMGGPAIRRVGEEALRTSVPGVALDAHALWDGCRRRTRGSMEDLARRIEPVAEWDDLVLPADQKTTLRQLAAQLRQRTRVYEEWGFEARSSRGLGISAVFAGPSGTGKTMAAEVLAKELRLDLYLIDLSQVVSKYIGETEKNLERIFSAAEAGGGILLFDEADALFGKRSEVRDSHDRYANIEVSFLLQRMESYRGLAVLTTNQRSALDQAFLRRVRFLVEFPFPDTAIRAEIWRRAFPAATPTAGLEPERLARLAVTGGNIRNIALNGAFLAADEGTPVRMEHLLAAARAECAKLDRPLAAAETAGWS